MRHRVLADLAKVIRSIIQQRKRREWDPILEQTRHWIRRLEPDRSPEAALFRERLKAIEGCLSLAEPLVQRFLQGEKLTEIELQTFASAAAEGKQGNED